jgi:hypothetical protein
MPVRRIISSFLVFASVGLGLGTASPALGTVMVEVPLDRMISDADAIIVGSVESHRTDRAVENGRQAVYTATRVRVQTWLKGHGGSTTEIVERGGSWQGIESRVAGVPEYREGDEVVVFLFRDPLGRYRTYGMLQGRFFVRSGIGGAPPVVERPVHGAAFVRWQAGQMTVGPGSSIEMTLPELVLRITRVLSSLPHDPSALAGSR